MTILPGPKDKCPECASGHAPDQPHNKDSLFFQYRFYSQYGRWPSWKEAMAHCTPGVQKVWQTELEKAGVWSEPVEKLSKEEIVGRKIGDLPVHSERKLAEPVGLMRLPGPEIVQMPEKKSKRIKRSRAGKGRR